MVARLFRLVMMAFLVAGPWLAWCAPAADKHGQPRQETMAKIRAKQITYEKDRVVARGDVVFVYKDMTIRTSVMTYHPKTGEVTTEGPVTFKRAGEKMHGMSLVYNVKSGNGTVRGVKGKTKNLYVQGEPIRGFLFFTGQSIRMKNGAYIIEHTNATTCDFPEGEQHYHITAERIEVYPGDKMIIFHGRLWLGKIPLWHVAKLVIDLHPRVRHRQSYFPHFGYNKIDGFFIKTVTNYLAYDNNYGNLLFDYYQKTGFAAGIQHLFPIGKRGSGELNLYHQNGSGFQHFTREQDSASVQYNFGGGMNATAGFNLFRFNVPPISSPDNITTNFSLTRRVPRYSWSLTEFSNATSGFTSSRSLAYHRNQDFGSGLTLDLMESYNAATQGGQTDSTLHNLTALTQRFSGWTASLYYDKTSSSLFSGGFLDRTPEFSLQSDPFELEPLHLPYQVSLSLANYFESFEKLNAWRYDFQLSIPTRTYDLSKNFHLLEGGLYRQDFYDTGKFYPTRRMSARYLLGNQTQISASLADHFDALIDYRSQSDIGFDPLVFDTFPPFRTLSAELSLHDKDFWRIDVGSAYDYKNKFYQQLVVRLDLRPKKDWFFHVDGFYDPNFKRWNDMIFQADFWPIKETALNGVRIQYWADYNVPTGKLGYEDIALYKEWHDWEARLIYQWHQQQVFLLFNLKAFPEQQVQLGINPVYYVPGSSQYMLP